MEDQIAARQEAHVGAAALPARSPEDAARAARRDTLLLARTRAVQDLQIACDRRYRALLEQTIEHLDRELNAL